MLKSEQAKNPSIESANKTDRPLLAKIGNQVKSEWHLAISQRRIIIEKLFKKFLTIVCALYINLVL